MLASLGCGNPTAVAELREGETVLDLGSGGGIDVILSARRVGPTGTAYGLDMTDEMLSFAQPNVREAGMENVSLLKGVIEQIPLPEISLDVVISNCATNLSIDKAAVLTEIARALEVGWAYRDQRHRRPGPSVAGRTVPARELRRLHRRRAVEGRVPAGLEAAGFEQISVEFGYEAADGLHGGSEGPQDRDAAANGLPVIEPAAKAGCR